LYPFKIRNGVKVTFIIVVDRTERGDKNVCFSFSRYLFIKSYDICVTIRTSSIVYGRQTGFDIFDFTTFHNSSLRHVYDENDTQISSTTSVSYKYALAAYSCFIFNTSTFYYCVEFVCTTPRCRNFIIP